MSNDETVDLREYVEVLRRRRAVFLLTAAGLFALSVTAAILWPPTYRSTASILIEDQDVPADLVRSAVTSSAMQRIETISQQVMTRANLMRIVEKYDLYVEAREENKTEKILASMRKRIKVDTLDVDVVDPRSGRPGRVVIAFTVSFEYRNPEVTQQVAEELAALFLEQNQKTRAAKASETHRFLTAEADRMSAQIAALEKKLAAFKEQNVMRLPELTELNLRLMDHTESRLAEVENQIRSLEERKYALEGDLAQISPWNPMVSSSGERVLDPITMLRTLRAEYVSASVRYKPGHPDVVRLRHEIEALEKQVGSIDLSQERAKTLARLRGELLVARDKYSEGHPDVVKLRREIAVLEAAPKQAQGTVGDLAVGAGIVPDNPAYITLRARLKAVDSELASMGAYRQQLQAKLADYEQRIAQGPRTERDYLVLGREHESALRRYREIKESQIEARVRWDLESQHGEKFSLIDPPQIPEEPIKPNRTLIAFLGFLFSLTGGVGSVALAEARAKWRDEPQDEEGLRLADAERTIAELRREVEALRGNGEVVTHPSSVSPEARQQKRQG